ncbi:MAG: hypothetical protein NZM12_05860, partial [Steroidobacteraceae bacterium]|nr:hypothetical protein [Steroidobacteraceae bacterium]
KEATQKVVAHDDGSISVTWRVPRVRRFPVIEPYFGADEPVDQLLDMRWYTPASISQRNTWMPRGAAANAVRVTIVTPHIVTPESPGRSHYFWTCEPDETSERFARAVFDGEDKPMIEAVQQRMGDADFWSLQPMILPGDRAAVRVRRRLDKLRRSEAQA